MPGLSQSRIAATLLNAVSKKREEFGLYIEIAGKIEPPEYGHLLDIGTGCGYQLKTIIELRPGLSLCGIDLSAEALNYAEKNLAGLEADLRVESIEKTNFSSDFFDIVTCHSSLSYWKNMDKCISEIYRILKPGGKAILFEPRKNIDIDTAVDIIRRKLVDAKAGKLRQFFAVNLNKYGLLWGRKLELKLYSIEELEWFLRNSPFGDQFAIEPVSLQDIPIYMQIKLIRVDKESKLNPK